MKQEERIISSMFEAAREEAPQLSFEDMAEQFSQQMPVAAGAEQGGMGAIKNLLHRSINLNSILLFSVGSLALLSIALTSREKEMGPLISQQEEVEIIEGKAEMLKPQALSTDDFSPPPPNPKDKQKTPVKIVKNIIPTPSKGNRKPKSGLDSPSSLEENSLATQIEDSLGMKLAVAEPQVDSSAILANHIKGPDTSSNTSTTNTKDTLKGPAIPKNVLVDERGKINDQKKVRKIDINGKVTLTLLNSYNNDMADQFLTQLKSYGLTIKKDRYRFRKGYIRNLFIQLTHHQGLDFKLRAAKFKRLDFILYFDPKDDLIGFSYHFNHDRNKTDIISLKARGSITQQY